MRKEHTYFRNVKSRIYQVGLDFVDVDTSKDVKLFCRSIAFYQIGLVILLTIL